ncbi:MAG TPA: ABC transporter permease [Solirubrobacteraceae bacterium]|nr:ABC transporter permease [Solirubrobacteraceae bacterium]
MIGAETLRIAIDGLLANRLRSGLTVLGLAIGVASVIVLIAVGSGSSKTVQQRIQALGTNVLLVTRGFQRLGARATAATAPLTVQAADALQDPTNAPDVQSAAPVVNAASATLVYNGTSYSPSTLVGTTPSYLTAHAYDIAAGSPFTSKDLSNHAAVVVVGPTVAENLFAGQSPLGQTIQINGSNFQVIGITQPKGSNGAQNQDDVAMAPLTTVQDQLTGYGSVSSITVQAKSRDQLDAAQSEVTTILEQQLHTTAENPGFQVINQGSILAASDSTSNVFTTLLGEVAAISLLVGGIGVMNIMLVSVTERTREIGIRKAIGARKSDILGQFLTEAVLVSIIGGLLGVLLGILGSQFKIAGVQPAIAAYSIFLAFGAAVATGLFFGTYPASRAAALRPIEALRYE